jgi:hypothetical protein
MSMVSGLTFFRKHVLWRLKNGTGGGCKLGCWQQNLTIFLDFLKFVDFGDFMQNGRFKKSGGGGRWGVNLPISISRYKDALNCIILVFCTIGVLAGPEPEPHNFFFQELTLLGLT